jgi:Sec-independent protein secretion pathway component TatC
MVAPPGRNWKIRRVVYFLLAIAAAVATPSPDAVTMLLVLLAGIVVFELCFLVYRLVRGG